MNHEDREGHEDLLEDQESFMPFMSFMVNSS
jgi:hypothetical protein